MSDQIHRRTFNCFEVEDSMSILAGHVGLNICLNVYLDNAPFFLASLSYSSPCPPLELTRATIFLAQKGRLTVNCREGSGGELLMVNVVVMAAEGDGHAMEIPRHGM